MANLQKEMSASAKGCPSKEGADHAAMAAIRKCYADAFQGMPFYKRMRARYDVTLTPQTIGGVYTEVFTPANGVAEENKNRVLINVHGGAFLGGARTWSHLESIPIAAVGRIKIISVDYRMGPEYTFPAASEDAAAVYREVLKTYKPGNIGIYGCSAGGLLTAQAVAWLQKEGMPAPGGVGMFCSAAAYWGEGDSALLGTATTGHPVRQVTVSRENPYLKNADPNDPLVFPVRSAQVMKKFPPSLLIASTRDNALSSVAYTHSVLVAQGVEADLHIWEGLDHGFFLDSEQPQSREVYDVVTKFFGKHLGKQ